MQPYQQASEEIQRQQSEPERLIKRGASTALALTGTGAIASRFLPFLSKYVPEGLAIKGLSKISPKVGKFINAAMDDGYTFDNIKEFIQGKVEKEEVKTEEKEKKNIIEQESTELHQFIDQEIRNGRNPIQAGAIAFQNKNFTQAINKLKNKYKLNWSSIIQQVYGTGDQALQQQQSPAQMQHPQPISNPAQGQRLAQQSQGSGQAKLMDVLQKLQQARQAR